MTRVLDVSTAPPPDWDALTVDPPGGHLLQGTAWAAHRRAQGWRPTFVRFDDGRAALVLAHARRPLPGFVAYAPRGPVAAGDPPETVAARAVAVADWLRRRGATILAVDPELDADGDYDAALARAGFRPTEEIQPSRHRLVLELPSAADDATLLAGMSKSTRQRIHAAEQGGTTVREDRDGRIHRCLRRSHGRDGATEAFQLRVRARLQPLVAADRGQRPCPVPGRRTRRTAAWRPARLSAGRPLGDGILGRRRHAPAPARRHHAPPALDDHPDGPR